MTSETQNRRAVDMSPEAIEERFRLVESLRKLAVSLKEAGERHRINTANSKAASVKINGGA